MSGVEAIDTAEVGHPVIGHLNLSRGFRGGERQSLLLIRELAQRGCRQIAVVREGQTLATRLSNTPGLEIRTVSGGFLDALRAARGAAVWHAHEGRGVHVAAGRHLFGGVPYIITRRVLNAPGTGFLTRYTYRNAAALVVISGAISRVMTEYPGTDNIRVIPSASARLASDPLRVQRLRSAYPDKFLVGHVGALDNSTKGQSYIIEAARALQRSHPKIHFMLVGDGKDGNRLKDEARGLHNISFTGFANNVGDYLALFDLFVFPSLHEGMGSTLVDAMEFGLPIIASDVGGIPDVIQDSENGILIEPGSSEPLIRMILALYDDPERRDALGAAAKNRATDFSVDNMVNGYIEVYRAVLGDNLIADTA